MLDPGLLDVGVQIPALADFHVDTGLQREAESVIDLNVLPVARAPTPSSSNGRMYCMPAPTYGLKPPMLSK